MAADGKVIIQTALDNDGFEKGSKELESSAKKLTGNVSTLGSKIKSALGTAVKVGAKTAVAAVGAAATAVAALTKQSIQSFAEHEQLAGGVEKIFDQMDTTQIATDAANAYKTLGLSANQYLSIINDVGATFAATMGDEAGYNAAKSGLKAISDYASGTGKSVDELSEKFTMITRSTSSYQSIADQFSGILPATSADFLKQAQAAGLLSQQYAELTEVPVAEYQQAVTAMLERGVDALGLTDNTAMEAASTLSGSFGMMGAAWKNLVAGIADENADLELLIGNFVESVGAVALQLIPKIGTALNGASKLITDLIPVIVQEIPKLIDDNLPLIAEAAVSIVKSLVDGVSKNQTTLFTTVFDVITYLAESFISLLPSIVKLGLDLLVSLATGIANSLPTLMPTIINVVLEIVKMLTDPATLNNLITASIAILLALANGLINALPQLISTIPVIVQNLITAFTNNAPMLIQAALQLIGQLVIGLIKAIPNLNKAVLEIITALVKGFGNYMSKMSEMGANIVAGLWRGLSSSYTWLKNKIRGWVGNVLSFIKRLFGIHSPSKKTAYFGKMLSAGLAKGITSSANAVYNAMSDVDHGISKRLSAMAFAPALSITPFSATHAMPRIPYLATGAVIPPNAPFTAVLGDQRNGTNLEAPESLIRQIVREESGGTGDTFNVRAIANGRAIFDLVIEEGKQRQAQTGRNPFVLQY